MEVARRGCTIEGSAGSGPAEGGIVLQAESEHTLVKTGLREQVEYSAVDLVERVEGLLYYRGMLTEIDYRRGIWG